MVDDERTVPHPPNGHKLSTEEVASACMPMQYEDLRDGEKNGEAPTYYWEEWRIRGSGRCWAHCCEELLARWTCWNARSSGVEEKYGGKPWAPAASLIGGVLHSKYQR